MPYKVLAFGLSDIGLVRQNNEDSWGAVPAVGFFALADGMGGHEAGEVASAIVTQVVADEVRDGRSLSDAIQRSHRSILDAEEQGLV